MKCNEPEQKDSVFTYNQFSVIRHFRGYLGTLLNVQLWPVDLPMQAKGIQELCPTVTMEIFIVTSIW